MNFHKGEHAIYIGDKHPEWYGTEVIVETELMTDYVFNNLTKMVSPLSFYGITVPSCPLKPSTKSKIYPYWAALPEHLAKLPPKQDWNNICNLNNIPVLEEA